MENEKYKYKVITIPNVLSFLRIAMIPFFVWTYIRFVREQGSIWIPFGILLLSGFTDIVDGFIARQFGMVSNVGRILDPIADKMLILGSLIALSGSARFSYLSLALVVSSLIILLREFTITSIRMVASREDGTVISANFAGKFKTAFSCAAVVIILLEEVIFRDGGLLGVHLLSYAALAISVILTVWSGITYMIKYFSYIDPRR